MNDGRDEDAEPASHYEVDYGKPPKEHQFPPGQSGNLRGRPVKIERSLTPRQFRNDFLRIAQTPTRIRTPHGDRIVTAYEASLITGWSKAISGNGPMLRHMLKHYKEEIWEHTLIHDFKFLEIAEIDWTNDPDNAYDTPHNRKYLNKLRRKTKRLVTD